MLGQAKRLYELSNLFHAKNEVKESTKIISFTSGKGGTGKSFICSNLSFQLSEEGKKVLLVDLDINLSNIGAIFNVHSKKNLYHYLNYDYDLDEIIFNYSENLDIILGESGRIDHPEFTEEKINLFLSELKIISAKYDYVLFDTSAGINKSTLQILQNSNEIIIVTSSEPTSVMDGYVIVKMMKSLGFESEINIVVNKTFEKHEGIIAFENLQKAVDHFLKSKIKYLGEVSFSKEVIQSIKDQIPLCKSKKTSEISNQLQEISSKIKIQTIG
ncbi:MAG: AAA family ATPase [Ignavibacteriae bacterium]|nr:AAA family ATPase [Ignavibacteriota bacterium]